MAELLFDLLSDQEDAIVAECVERVIASSEHYAAAQPGTIAQTSRQLLRLMVDLHRDPLCPAARAAIRQLCELRVPMGFRLGEVMSALFIYNDVVNPRIRLALADDSEQAAAVEDQFRTGVEQLAVLWAEGYFDLQQQLLAEKDDAVRKLSTPVLQIWDGVLALPLVGDVDDRRSRQITEELLATIIETQSPIVLVDITGLGHMDTAVIAQMMRTVRAARMLGTDVWIVGVSPAVAQTIVGLGVDLGRMTTFATLRQGLDTALAKLGLQVVETVEE